MNVTGFLDRIEEIYDGPIPTATPRDPGVMELCEDVEGMTTPNQVAALQRAVEQLPADEAYLEVGTFRGRSLTGAMQGDDSATFYAMENFVEFGMLGEQARADLMDNLARYGSDRDLTLLEGDAFTLMAQDRSIDKPVGVYFYDGEHTTLAHYLALGVAEPLLADEALVLIDDASWPLVQKAHRLFMARHKGWSVERRFDAAHQDDPHWANGLHVLRFTRPAGRARRLTADVRALLVLQRFGLGPARKAIWQTLHRWPQLVPLAKRLNPTSSSTVER